MAWAVDRLCRTFEERAAPARVVDRSAPAHAGAVLVTTTADPVAAAAAAATGTTLPEGPEAFAILPDTGGGVTVCGSDVRGLVYAVLELVDRVRHGEDPRAALPRSPVRGSPANAVRSVMRLFCSEEADLPWFRDQAFWDGYLTMLIEQRFNRFSLTLGLGYNYHRAVTDAYLYFAYPFLLTVPGYDVRVPQLPHEERDRNLDALRLISEMSIARGLDFQLGLWTHAFEWIDSPDARHTIEGLSPERHAAYCRDALALVLDRCPAIGGVTLRIHGESGVPEKSWDFWRTVFAGVAAVDRTVSLDLHAKGLDEVTLRDALETGLPVTVSPKFWAEHMGLPYHQAAIREHERLVREDPSARSDWHRAMSVSEGSRPFTRYGYADFLREDRDYDIVYRLWPGTQRVLLWGDPLTAAAYGRVSSVGGAGGLEWFEPLSFVGREGTGKEGSRTGYEDPALVPERDWQKYAYTYRLFGRLTYDPGTPSDEWRRPLHATFGHAAEDAEAALASASRILPLVTTAHHPSASNNYFWPELYTDMPIVWSESGTRPHEYRDTPTPRRFGTVSPLDPEVFATVQESVLEHLEGSGSGRVSSLDVAANLERFADEASDRLGALTTATDVSDPAARRWTIDVAITAALGRFFAAKLRAAFWYELDAETDDPVALRRAVDAYREARRAWADASARATGIYEPDLAHGPQAWLRGHWADRLPAIEADLADMEERLAARESGARGDEAPDPAGGPRPVPPGFGDLTHEPPSAVRRGASLELEVTLGHEPAGMVKAMSVRYRPMNQAVAVSEREMTPTPNGYRCTIPGVETDTPYPLAYAFVVHPVEGAARRFPGLGATLTEQPYFIVSHAREEVR